MQPDGGTSVTLESLVAPGHHDVCFLLTSHTKKHNVTISFAKVVKVLPVLADLAALTCLSALRVLDNPDQP